jgi:serine/alanine adding enzyme
MGIDHSSQHRHISAAATAQNTTGVRITRWTPDNDEQWLASSQTMEHAHLAQAPQWFSVIQHAYGHTPLYLQAEGTEGATACIPAFLVRSRWFGTLVTSMPFLDAGGPCSTSESLARVLVDRLLEEARQLGASLVELRCTTALELPVPAIENKVNLILPLPADPACLWRQLNAKVRNQVGKAQRSGLSVEFGGVELLDDFYEVFLVNMRDLGSPVHAREFFRAILNAFGDKARVAIVRKEARAVGGLIALAFKNTLIVPWASSLRQYFSLCPNMLLYWEVLRSACAEGFQRFEFGRSSRDSGTYRFKRQWGAHEEPLFWYFIPLGSRRVRRLSSDDRHAAHLVRLWQHLPVSLTRWLGPAIRKYLTQ